MQSPPGFVSEKAHHSLQKDYDRLAQITDQQQQKIAYLEQELAQLKRMVFGQKRERLIAEHSGQLSLTLPGAKTIEEVPEKEHVSYERKKSKKKGKAVRLKLPDHLPRQTETIEPEQLQEGAKQIGKTVTEIHKSQNALVILVRNRVVNSTGLSNNIHFGFKHRLHLFINHFTYSL